MTQMEHFVLVEKNNNNENHEIVSHGFVLETNLEQKTCMHESFKEILGKNKVVQ